MQLSFIPAAEVFDVGLLPSGGGWISRESVFCGPASPERLAILNDRDTSIEERLSQLLELRGGQNHAFVAEDIHRLPGS